MVEYFKKSVPHRDLILVTETLVAHAVNQCVSVDEPFEHCRALLVSISCTFAYTDYNIHLPLVP